MLELAFNLTTRCDRQALVKNIAGNAGAGLYYKIACLDRAIDPARKPRRFGDNLTDDHAAFALDDRTAGDVAMDLAINMQVDLGRQIAGDFNIRCDDRKCVSRTAHIIASLCQ